MRPGAGLHSANALAASLKETPSDSRQPKTTREFSALKRPMSWVLTVSLPKLPSRSSEMPRASIRTCVAYSARSASQPESPAPTQTAISEAPPA